MKTKITDWWLILNNQIIDIMNAFLKKEKQKIDANIFINLYETKFGKVSNTTFKMLSDFVFQTNQNINDFTLQQWAYAYATTHHETNATFAPVKEAYWIKNAEAWRKKNLRYWPFYGRGFVQLTWKDNYQKYAELFDVDIVENPDLVMDFELSFNIMVHGMKNGTFTGKKVSDYISNLKADYVGARRVINGTDKAQLIAGYAQKFESIIKESIK